MNFLIKGAHITDPGEGIDGVYDILVEKKKIKRIRKNIRKTIGCEIINASGLYIIPGLVDMHVHFREPGYEYKETIETGVRAAISGGYAAVVTMPNTNPAVDKADIVRSIIEKGKVFNFDIYPCGAITKGRQGKEMSEYAELKEAGIVMISDDGSSVSNSLLLRRAMEYASMLGLLVSSHCEESSLSALGVVHEGQVSVVMGLKGIPSEAESIVVARDIELANISGAKLHIQHVSAKRSIAFIREAKKRGLSVTAEVTPHHIAFNEGAISDYNTNYKMNPPLRSREDQNALIKALKDGVIDVIATDHAPHSVLEKGGGFDSAPFGVIGLETAFPVTLTYLYHRGVLTLGEIVEKMSLNPQKILGIEGRYALREGNEANFVIFDPNKEIYVEETFFASKSKNSPFIGMKLYGEIIANFVKGFCYDARKLRSC